MKHPFDGVIGAPDVTLDRRAVLGTLATAAVGLVSCSAAAAQVTSQAIGEEGAVPTTLAIGEEGAGRPVPQVTTEPFGEEAGKVVSRMTPGLEDGGKAQPITKALNEQGGPSTEAKNEEGGVSSTAIGEEGGPSTRAVGEEGGLTKALGEDGLQAIIPVKPGTVELKKEQFQTVWTDLGSKDPVKGVQACAVLYGAKNGVNFIKSNLTTEKIKLRPADEKTVAKLIDELDSEDFETREKAEKTLSRMGPPAAVALEKALKGSKSPEQTMRLKRLLETVKNPPALAQAPPPWRC